MPPSGVEFYGFGIDASDNRMIIRKWISPDPLSPVGPVYLYDPVPSSYWGANGVWELVKEGSLFSVWYNGTLVGNVYDIPELADKEFYFVADARRYSGFETAFIELDSVRVIAERAAVPARVDLDPDTLDLRSQGGWVTAYIEVAQGDIDITTVILDGKVPAECSLRYGFVKNPQRQDRDGNGVPELMVKFSREAVQAALAPGNAIVSVTGNLTDGRRFEAHDTIRVID
jgi:hypothetical protein